jgi:MFS family permease
MLLVLSAFISYVDRGNLSVAAPLLKSELGITTGQLGGLLSAFFWSYTLMLFVCAWRLDRWDAPRALAVGFTLWSAATAVTGLVSGFATLIVVRVLLGAGESVTFPCYCAILSRHVPEQHRGLANGAIVAAIKFGPAAGTLGVGLLMAQYGWRPVFVVLGIVSLLWVPVWRHWGFGTAGNQPPREPAPAFLLILRQRPFWATAAGSFCALFPIYFMVTWLPYYLVHEHRLTMIQMTWTAALYYLTDGGSALATGWTTDRLIRAGRSAGRVRKGAMLLGWTIAALGLLACAWGNAEIYLPWLLVTGIGVGMGNSGLWTFAQTLAGPAAAGRWSSLQNALANFAGIIGPAVTGLTVDWTGHFQLALTLTAGICLLGGFIWPIAIGEFREIAWTQTRPGAFQSIA